MSPSEVFWFLMLRTPHGLLVLGMGTAAVVMLVVLALGLL